MQKQYAANEILYQRMKAKGLRSLGQLNDPDKGRDITEHAERFLTDALAQPWAPKGGRAIELGCGTAPMLRWLCKRGFSGLGVDVSKTAIAMARAQSRGFDVRFRRADLCDLDAAKPGTFDLALDGHCLHCITRPADRRGFLKTVHRLLTKDGVFIVLSMCAPVDRKLFSKKHPGHRLVGHTLYVPFAQAGEYQGSRKIAGSVHAPIRYIGHWQSILVEIRKAGFHVQLVRYNAPQGDDPGGDLAVAALPAS